MDNKDGQIMVEGWKTATAMTVDEALEKYTTMGVRHFLITSIAQDGMLNGPTCKLSAKPPYIPMPKSLRREESAA